MFIAAAPAGEVTLSFLRLCTPQFSVWTRTCFSLKAAFLCSSRGGGREWQAPGPRGSGAPEGGGGGHGISPVGKGGRPPPHSPCCSARRRLVVCLCWSILSPFFSLFPPPSFLCAGRSPEREEARLDRSWVSNHVGARASGFERRALRGGLCAGPA